jgi:exo-beta-1,3-glucanase (GH17 family)
MYLFSINIMNKLYFFIIFLFAVVVSSQACMAGFPKDVNGPLEENKNLFLQDESALLEGVHAALCYSGYRSGQHPDRGQGAVNPSDEEILEDLHIMQGAGFNLIRLYDSGENSESVIRLIAAHQLNIKVMLGIWLRAEISNHESCAWLTEPIPQEELHENYRQNALEIQKGIRLAREYPEIIRAVNVGNEALVDWNDHKVHPDTMIAYVRKVKQGIQQPVTVAENYVWWSMHGAELAKEVDFVTLHLYPVWEEKDIDEGLSYSIANVQQVNEALPDSKIVIGEAGWASIASEFGDRASEEKQLRYYNELMAWALSQNITTFFFEAFDEDWKGHPGNPLGAEKHWGLFTVDRQPKKAMRQHD